MPSLQHPCTFRTGRLWQTHTLSVKAGDGALRAVRITMMKTVMRKRARTAPMMAPAMAMELDLWA